MGVQVAKKPVAAVPAKPAAPAPVAPVVQTPAAIVEETTEDQGEEEAEETKAERKTRKDFPAGDEGWKAFCDYKIDVAKANVTKWTDRIEIWEKKKTNKTADTKEKTQKKADKLFAAWIQTQRNLGIPEDVIQKGLETFKAQMAAAVPKA